MDLHRRREDGLASRRGRFHLGGSGEWARGDRVGFDATMQDRLGTARRTWPAQSCRGLGLPLKASGIWMGACFVEHVWSLEKRDREPGAGRLAPSDAGDVLAGIAGGGVNEHWSSLHEIHPDDVLCAFVTDAPKVDQRYQLSASL